MNRNKCFDCIDFERSEIEIDSLIDYIELDLFEQYEIVLIAKKGLFNKSYIVHNFSSCSAFTEFISRNSDLIVCSISSVYCNDDSVLRIYVKA